MKSLIAKEIDPALDILERNFNDSIAGVYLFGSAVTGGLRPRSDVDILVAVTRPIGDESRMRLAEDLLAVSGEPAARSPIRPLEVTVVVLDDVVPWRYPPRREFQYGEWLRDDVTAGKLLLPAPDPDLAILLTQVRQRSRPLFGPDAADLFDSVPPADLYRALLDIVPGLVDNWRGDERNTVLTLARIWVTLETGEIVPKDSAAECIMTRLPAVHRDILEIARSEYLGEREEDWRARNGDVGDFVEYAQREIRTLANIDSTDDI